jgi:arylsulfatase A-like enzyme
MTATVCAGWCWAAIDAIHATSIVDSAGLGATFTLALTALVPLLLLVGLGLSIFLELVSFDPSPGAVLATVRRVLGFNKDAGLATSARLVTVGLTAGLGLACSFVLTGFFMSTFHNTQLAALTLTVSLALLLSVGLLTQRRLTTVVQGWLERLGLGRPALWIALASVGCTAGLFALVSGREQTIEAIPFGLVLVPLGLCLTAYAFTYLVEQLPRRLGPVVTLASVILTVVVTVPSFGAGSEAQTAASYSLIRYAWFAHVPLQQLQSVFDADGDGFSTALGGGDCDDGDSDAYPGAPEVPNDGVDQSCSGRDLVVNLDTPEPEVETAVTEPEMDPVSEIRRPWNVVFITVDTLRPDHLGFAGYEREDISPYIDSLASISSRFLNAYSPSAKTPTAIPPLLASRWPSEMERTYHHFVYYDDENLFLAEVLRDHGYSTAASVSHWYFRERYGFAQGFDDWREVWVAGSRMERVSTSEQVADEAIAFLDEHYAAGETVPPTEQPFFLWLHFFDPHKLYIPHDEFEAYGTSSMALYDGEIRFSDHHVGRFLDRLEAEGAFDETVIIFTSDHGEAFGEHSMRHHGWDLYEHQIRVPLLVYIPGVPPGEFDERVSLMDLAPTILDVVGIDVPESFRGRSLLRPIVLGEEPEQRPIFTEMPRGPHNSMKRSFTLGDWKLIFHASGNRYRLFNLLDDPGELNDLWDEEPEEAARMRDAFEVFLLTQVEELDARRVD